MRFHLCKKLVMGAAMAGSLPGFLNAQQLPAEPPAAPMSLALPTDNDALLRGDGPGFYMYVDRNFEKQQSTPWEGGMYGFVRGPVRHHSKLVLMAFHEGIDIAPLKRDSAGEPLDEVRSISHGTVVHVNDQPGASNYGRYIVVQHDWTDGSFYSLYAHLARIDVQVGRPVTQGSTLGILGHTGDGLDRRRSHLHLEINLILSSKFNEWHQRHFQPSPNHHGIYNGLNLSGIDVAQLYLARQKTPDLQISQLLQQVEPEWKILVPRKNKELELLSNYPWLARGENIAQPSASWEISLTGSGLPLHIRPSDETVAKPSVSWVKDLGIPHVYHTRRYVSGSGGNGTLTASGTRFVELLTGDFIPPTPR